MGSPRRTHRHGKQDVRNSPLIYGRDGHRTRSSVPVLHKLLRQKLTPPPISLASPEFF